MAAKYFNPYTDFGYEQYKKSLVQYLEVKNVFDTAFEEGEKSGIEKVAKALKEQNIAIEIIAESTGLSYEAIQRIWVNNANW